MKEIFKRENWSDPLKWKMDLLKWTLTFSLGALITVGGIGIYERHINAEDFKWQKRYSLKLNALQDFKINSSTYIKWSYDAIADAVWCHSNKTSTNMSKWENEGYENFMISLENIRDWNQGEKSKKLITLLDSLEETQIKLGELYKAIRKDSIPNLMSTDSNYCKCQSNKEFEKPAYEFWYRIKMNEFEPLKNQFYRQYFAIKNEAAKLLLVE